MNEKIGFVLKRVPGKLYVTGKSTWSHGTAIRWDSWNRSPSHWMRGPCPNCGSPTSSYGGSYTCHNDYCPQSADNYACNPGKDPEWWETQVNVFLDGNAWCATLDGFVNLQQSVAGFGATPSEAVENLLADIKRVDAALEPEPEPEPEPETKNFNP